MKLVVIFDAIIYITITSAALIGAALCIYKKKHAIMNITLPSLVILTMIYGSFIEPQRLVVTQTEFSFPSHKKLKTEKTIALISDIHVGPYKDTRFVERIVTKLLEYKPDVVFIAGDFLFIERVKEASEKLNPLKRLAERIPTIAVLGNHEFKVGVPGRDIPKYDEAADVRSLLKKLGVLELEDATHILFANDPKNQITLMGAQDLWSGVNDLSRIESFFANHRSIVLAHNPDIIYEVMGKADLVLAGHTHGGQIRLPLLGAIGSPGSMRLPRRHFKGWSTWGTTRMFITSGTGESGPRARLFNPPEIALITLR